MDIESVFLKQWKSTGELPRLLELDYEVDGRDIIQAVVNLGATILPYSLSAVSSEPNSTKYKLEYTTPDEFSVVILKPDCILRKLEAKVLQRFLDKDLYIESIYKHQITRPIAERHYKDLEDTPYFERIVNSIVYSKSMSFIVRGAGCIETIRSMIGDKDPLKALPGTIRGDFGTFLPHNIIHASKTLEEAMREVENLMTLYITG